MMGIKKFFMGMILLLICLWFASGSVSQAQGPQVVQALDKMANREAGVIKDYVQDGRQYDRLIIRNVMIIDGNGTPAKGPTSVLVEGNKITSVGSMRAGRGGGGTNERVIDGTGMYCLPGLINAHAHLQNSRGRLRMPF